MLYIFLLAYGSYGGRDTGCSEITHYIAFFLAAYLMGTALELYILSQIKVTWKWLNNLLTTEYASKYLDPHVVPKYVLKLFIPVMGLGLLEVYSADYSLAKDATEVLNKYSKTYGADSSNWDEEIKKAYVSEMLKVGFENRNGAITHTMNSDKIKTLVSMISNTIKTVMEIIFKK